MVEEMSWIISRMLVFPAIIIKEVTSGQFCFPVESLSVFLIPELIIGLTILKNLRGFLFHELI